MMPPLLEYLPQSSVSCGSRTPVSSVPARSNEGTPHMESNEIWQGACGQMQMALKRKEGKTMKIKTLTALGMLAFLAACAQQEEPPTTVVPEPVYDKYGNVISSPEVAAGVVMMDTDGDGVGDTPVTPEPPSGETPPYQNRNTIENQTQNQNQNRGG